MPLSKTPEIEKDNIKKTYPNKDVDSMNKIEFTDFLIDTLFEKHICFQNFKRHRLLEG